MPSLHFVTGDGGICDFSISKDRITIGRSKENDVVLTDSSVSRRHAEIEKGQSGYFITDLGSYNQTKLNGEFIEKAPLKHGDEIELGMTRLTYLSDHAAEKPLKNSLLLTTESDDGSEVQEIVRTSPFEASVDSRELLFAIEVQEESGGEGRLHPFGRSGTEAGVNLSSLARANKVLFVLYEISRNLNQIHDFNALLRKIMDLIFMVIDADSGFLVLTGGIGEDELIPVVVKHREGKVRQMGDMKASRTVIHRVIRDQVALLTSNAMTDSRLEGAQSVMLQRIRSAICVPLWKKDKIIGVIQLDSVRIDNQFTRDDLELVKAIASQVAMVIEQADLNQQIREEETMRSRLERFHSPQVVEMILRGAQERKDGIMEPREVMATILFTDIIGFTHLSEKMPAAEININLNRYFSRMTDIVFMHDGTLDKYIGDGLMAVFGAPVEKENHPEKAIRAALEMRSQLSDLMKEMSPEMRFDIRTGINTGRVMAGNIGSPKRMEYTVIGSPVNIAAGLESIALPNQILIGEETYKRVKDQFRIQKVGLRAVKGKSTEIIVYEVIE